MAEVALALGLAYLVYKGAGYGANTVPSAAPVADGGRGTPPVSRPGTRASQAASFVVREGDEGYYSWLQTRLDHGDFRGKVGRRQLQGRSNTQWATNNAQLLPSQFYQQDPTRQPLKVISTARNIMSTVPVHMSDQYKEFIRMQIQNTEWHEVPFRGVRAEFYPDRERRRTPFFNNPNSVFISSAIKVPQEAVDVEIYRQAPKMPIDNRL
jgi:hypothetical protein